jgi:hypothetical protein
MYGSDGGTGGSSVVRYGNDMNNALTDWATSRTSVGNDTWNKIGTTIAKTGNLASNFVGGPQGTQLGGKFGKAVQGYNNAQSGFDASNFEGNSKLFDFNQFGGKSGDGKFGGGMDFSAILGGQGGQGGGIDLTKIMGMLGGGAEHGGNIKRNDMRTKLYSYGDKVTSPSKEGLGYTTEPTLPPGVTWDGSQYIVNPDANTTFEIEEGNTHENGGTFMNVPAEGEGNTTIEAEKGEVADVKNGETYIWSKNKVPGTSLTFAQRKQKRDKDAEKIETELELISSSNTPDEYRKNTLLRSLMLLETEENSDKTLQANIKRRNE